MDDFVRNGMDNPLSPIDRRPRHILEVSAAQQRQQELQQRRGSLPVCTGYYFCVAYRY